MARLFRGFAWVLGLGLAGFVLLLLAPLGIGERLLLTHLGCIQVLEASEHIWIVYSVDDRYARSPFASPNVISRPRRHELVVINSKEGVVRRETRAPSIPLCHRFTELRADTHTGDVLAKYDPNATKDTMLFLWGRNAHPGDQELVPWIPANKAWLRGDFAQRSWLLHATDNPWESFRVSNSTGTIVVEYRPAEGETREVLTVEVRREEKIERIDLFLGQRGQRSSSPLCCNQRGPWRFVLARRSAPRFKS